MFCFTTVARTADDKGVFTSSKELPLEMSFLLESLQTYHMTETEKESFSQSIFELDFSLSKLSKEEIYFLGKSEIYKIFLRPASKSSFDLASDLFQLLKKAQEKLMHENKSYHPFAIWLLMSIRSDLESIANSTVYTQFHNLAVSNGTFTSAEMIRMARKLSLILPVFNNFLEQTPEEFQDGIRPKMLKTLATISKHALQLLQFAYAQEHDFKNTSVLLVFKKVTSENKQSVRPVTIDEILAPLFVPKTEPGFVAPEKLPPPVSGWDDNTILIAPTPDPSYQPPEKLPDPIDDWYDKLPTDLPTPDPNYVPPKELPVPVVDWNTAPPTPTPALLPTMPPPTPSSDTHDPDDNWRLEP